MPDKVLVEVYEVPVTTSERVTVVVASAVTFGPSKVTTLVVAAPNDGKVFKSTANVGNIISVPSPWATKVVVYELVSQ